MAYAVSIPRQAPMPKISMKRTYICEMREGNNKRNSNQRSEASWGRHVFLVVDGEYDNELEQY
jgi:hypothetical protein